MIFDSQFNTGLTGSKKKLIDEHNEEHQSIVDEEACIEEDRKYLSEIDSKILENFELEKIIGIGSGKKIYKALMKNSNKEISLKVIFKKNKENKNNYNEINISNKLKNRNVISHYGAFIENNLDCIIMEHGKYGNLKDFKNKILQKDYLSESSLCFIAYQILNGLKYIHISKIAHFDLKPQNIIINEYLEVKIIDFSVSVDYSKIHSKKIKLPFRGTCFYMAPQIIKTETINVKDLDKIDLYSLGVILYYLAFNSYPFRLNKNDAKNYDKIYEKITKDFVCDEDSKYYSSHFINFLKKLLEKDIDKRINLTEAMNDYWIKGAEILMNEKEKIGNASIFLSYLLTDHFKNYEDYNKK